MTTYRFAITGLHQMSQGQVNDIKNNTLADVTVTGH